MQTNWLKDEETEDNKQYLTSERWQTDYMYQEKKKEDSPSLIIQEIHKKSEKRLIAAGSNRNRNIRKSRKTKRKKN